ncbi:hypothetical protein AB0G55_11775 [Streptomyces toyocaensis]|uniref:hypothetical protein n=1 Tax=Streptomyces toyocaensis TaxID=55952 RepID=UPI00068DB435|nr:hypothetical protein [Streptomyces toyocaensis]
MGERRAMRKMLRRMESGEPVQVTRTLASTTRLARLAAMAREFGYDYADVHQGGGAQGNGYVVALVPDPGPRARARAARNRARHPGASDGGPLPALAPDEVELLKARITYDITAMYTGRQLIVLTGVGAVPLALPVGLAADTGTTAVLVVTCAVWAALMALLPVGFAVNRRFRARYAAVLRAAGFTPVTEPGGRLRYLPSGGTPGHGNPFGG